MSYIETTRAGSGGKTKLFYEDWGSGAPIVLIHGWPLDHQMWEHQLRELPQHGFRVIAADRRGFGKSDQPWDGYDYDTLADDLKAVLDSADVQDATLVGFSMGGGEVARYMSRHAGARVGRVAFVSAVTPYLLKTDDNPDGVDGGVFDEMVKGLGEDRPDFLAGFGKKFFGVGMLSKPVSQATLDWTQSLALNASPRATLDCVRAFSATDFRADLASITVPTLVVHGDEDVTVPIKVSGARTAKAVPHATYKVYEGAPHGLFSTHKDQLTADLVAFASGRG